MAQRTATARFMPGAWVFPGGVVDDGDWSDLASSAMSGPGDAEDRGWRAAALRETVEETGIWLSNPPFALSADDRARGASIYERAASGAQFDVSGLTYFANWITPADLPVRFDTRFYLAAAPFVIEGTADCREMDDVAWVSVAEAAAGQGVGAWTFPFPTLKTIEWFASFANVEALMTWARSLDQVPVTEPRVRRNGDIIEILLPWDAGYSDLPELSQDVAEPAGAGTVRAADGSLVAELQPPSGGGRT